MKQEQKKPYDKLMGELESYVGEDCRYWSREHVEKAQDLLTLVEFNLQDLHFRLEPGATVPCKGCGVLTEGSTGRAGIRWHDVCQGCKDEADNAMLGRFSMLTLEAV